MSAVCPVCQKDDQIKKIAAIRIEGIQSGAFIGPTGGIAVMGGKIGPTVGMTTLAGSTITELA